MGVFFLNTVYGINDVYWWHESLTWSANCIGTLSPAQSGT